MPRKGKLTIVTQDQEGPEQEQEDTQVVDVFSQLEGADVEYPEDTVPGEGYSEADNPSNGWQAPDTGGDSEGDPDAGPEDHDLSEPPTTKVALKEAGLGQHREIDSHGNYYGHGTASNAQPPEAGVSEPPTPDVDPGATDPPPISVHAPELPVTPVAEVPPPPAPVATEASVHIARLNAMTRGELMAYAAEEIGIKVRDTWPKPKILDTILGTLVKGHVPGSIKESAVAHRTVGGTPASPNKPKVPQAKVVAMGVACPGCGKLLAQEDGRTTWNVGTHFLPAVHTCACGVAMQTPKELHAPPPPALAVSPTPQPEAAVPPADTPPTADAATEPAMAAVAA